MESSLQLDFDIEVQAKLETDGLGVGQTGKDLRAVETTLLLDGTLVSAAAAAAGVDRGDSVGVGVVELCFFTQVRFSFSFV